MKLYKSNNNEIFAYEEDGSQDHLIGDKIAITQEEANAINAEKELAKFNALSYAEKRARAYPPIQDQLDMQYWDKINGTNNWETLVTKVKEKYPKG